MVDISSNNYITYTCVNSQTNRILNIGEISKSELGGLYNKQTNRLAMRSHCILSICNIYLFSVLVLRAGFAF